MSLAQSRQTYQNVEFHPEVLRDVSTVDTRVTVIGGASALPFGIAPTGFTRMMRTAGERAGAAAAGAAGIPFSLSTVGTASSRKSRGRTRAAGTGSSSTCGRNVSAWPRSIERAAKAGFDTLLVTVDVPVSGARLRDRHNGLTIPPAFPAPQRAQRPPAAPLVGRLPHHPADRVRRLQGVAGTVAELLDPMFDPSVGYDDFAWIKEQWPGSPWCKGVQTLEDAKRVAELGVQGMTLSNHGGRPLDRAPVPFHLLPNVVRELPRDAEMHLDTGIMNGADIVAAIAFGAGFTLVGRAYLYGLMAGGRPASTGRSRSSPARSSAPCASSVPEASTSSARTTSRSSRGSSHAERV